MNNQDNLFLVVKNDITFDTLLAQAKAVIEQQSGQCWNDTGENDPGITLLEACCYGASDLAYRHSLPLRDLLTLEENKQKSGDGIFPQEFGPQQMLTCGPVTAEDYRRALLDLRSNDTVNGYFFFIDALLIHEPSDQRYKYWYNKKERKYSFTQNRYSNNQQLTLRGNYWLYLIPSRETENDKTQAQKNLEDFLKDNRNLGESVSKIIWLEPIDLKLQIDIQLDDDAKDIADIFAKVYMTTEQMVLERPLRYTTQDMIEKGYNNEQIFEGPYLRHGWIPKLPQTKDYTHPTVLNLSPLVNQLLAIKGVKNVTQFTLGEHDEKISKLSNDNWSWEIKLGYYPRLWGEDPLESIILPNSPLTITTKGGVKAVVTKQQVEEKIIADPLIDTKPELLNWGKHRKVLDYYPVSNKLPACYELQANPHQQVQLHQFMLPFEQMLANGCAELALLPKLLAFKQREDIVHGAQLPFKTNTVSQKIYQNIESNLKEKIDSDSQIDNKGDNQNYKKELKILDYLLRYFGVQRATIPIKPNLKDTDYKDFLSTQREYLAQQPDLAYQRNNIRIDKVSALQKRIAARLGLGGECFSEKPKLDKLPFYLIEHRQLLPVKPDEKFNENQTPTNLEIQDDQVKITQSDTENQIKQGQVINLTFNESDEYGDLTEFTLLNQMITEVAGNTFTLNINNSSDLKDNKDKIKAAFDQDKLNWCNSPVWMEDMDYQLDYASEPPSHNTENERWITISDQSHFPSMIEKNDEITLTIKFDYKLSTHIEKLDRSKRQILLRRKPDSKNNFPPKEISSLYFWYIDRLDGENELVYSDETSSHSEKDECWITVNDEIYFQNILNNIKDNKEVTLKIKSDDKLNTYIEEFNHENKQILLKRKKSSKNHFPLKETASLYFLKGNYSQEKNELIYASEPPSKNSEKDEYWITISNEVHFKRIFESSILTITFDYKLIIGIKEFNKDKSKILIEKKPGSKYNFPKNEEASMYLWHIDEYDRGIELVYADESFENSKKDECWITISDKDSFKIIYDDRIKEITLKFKPDYKLKAYIKKLDYDNKRMLLRRKPDSKSNFPQKEIVSLYSWSIFDPREENKLVYASDTTSDSEEDECWITIDDEEYLGEISRYYKEKREVILDIRSDYTLSTQIEKFDPIKRHILLKKESDSTNNFPKKEVASLYRWHLSGKRYAQADHFSFVVSVVLNRELIGSGPVDLYKLESWVKSGILAELPAHISLVIHWLSPEDFKKFATTYKLWQNNGAPLGDQAYKILETLTLGKQPSASADTSTLFAPPPAE
ncbi:hypothetical protein BB987_01510 [Photorhabdus temperata]|uniref:Uncharacterized protein n=1 Tax=Photorhabdus khanii NC19 TaxID=1004151 RepID=W3V4H1_9GAMM|nr:hypothetical protein PTE_02624 [Photorhabdus khanii NC19]OHV54045.1 hypothetical protein BB987_01510 [Photorhabdus temperata]